MENIKFKKSFEEDSGAIGFEVGKLLFSHNDDELIVDHTEVTAEKRGADLAPQLVKEALKLSKEKNLDIKSNCSYASKVLQRIK
jgi:uncharacterized protein